MSPRTDSPTGQRRGRLARYALWQASDYALERGVPAVIVGVLLLLGPVLAVRGLRAGAIGMPSEPMAIALFGQVLGAFALFGALFATNGIVANDRTHGFFRFLFAKPVRVPRYYAQALLVHGVGLLLVTAVVYALFAVVVRPIPSAVPGIFAYVAAVFVAFGGLTFLASSLVRLDWVVAFAAWGAGLLARQLAPPAQSWWGAALDVLLPPSHLSDELRGTLMAGRVPYALLGWYAAYGVVAVVTALGVLHRRELAG